MDGAATDTRESAATNGARAETLDNLRAAIRVVIEVAKEIEAQIADSRAWSEHILTSPRKPRSPG